MGGVQGGGQTGGQLVETCLQRRDAVVTHVQKAAEFAGGEQAGDVHGAGKDFVDAAGSELGGELEAALLGHQGRPIGSREGDSMLGLDDGYVYQARKLADQRAPLIDQYAGVLVYVFEVGDLLIQGCNLRSERVDLADGLDHIQVEIAVLKEVARLLAAVSTLCRSERLVGSVESCWTLSKNLLIAAPMPESVPLNVT